jgi:polyphosphate glucokinase
MTPEAKTLAVDVGGTGIKASVLDAAGKLTTERVRVATTYPMEPGRLVDVITELAGHLPAYDRVSIGFPGVVREGHVLTAPHFVTEKGPGTRIAPALERSWRGYDLAGAVGTRLGKPARAANDADLQGAAVVTGEGLELVVTLGTGVGTALFYKGRLAAHLELAHHPFRRDQTYNDQLGDATRNRIGKRRWNKRVHLAIRTLYNLVVYDHLFIGGGNSGRVSEPLDANITIVGNEAGILGGIKLWEREEM